MGSIFNEEHVDLQHIYIDGSKFEANANKYTWVWKKATEKFRYKLYEKITTEIEEINTEIAWSGVQISANSEYVPDYLNEIIDQLVLLWDLDISTFVYGSGKRKSNFNEEHVDLQHIYIDGSKFEANANKYTWVWKKATEKFRYKLYEKITTEIEEINTEIAWSGVQISATSDYVPD